MMNTKIFLAVAAASVIALTGCGTSLTNQQIGTGTGAVLGGVAGSALGGGTLGTVGGAAAGAVIGSEIGKKQDEKR
jgi:osmotically inducible lipoprotein OsmB